MAFERERDGGALDIGQDLEMGCAQSRGGRFAKRKIGKVLDFGGFGVLVG